MPPDRLFATTRKPRTRRRGRDATPLVQRAPWGYVSDMRNVVRLVAVPFVVSAVLAAGPARADLAPPPLYVEECTMENAPKDQECHRCGAFFGNRTWCSDELASYGFSRNCRTRGASVWGEIWCRPKAASNKAVPKEVLAELGTPTRKVTPPEDAGAPPLPSSSSSAGASASSAPPVTPVPSVTAIAPPGASSPSAPNAPSAANAPPTVPPKQSCGACDVGARSPVSALALAASAGLAVTLLGRRRASRRRP